jgi:hypothetical protein
MTGILDSVAERGKVLAPAFAFIDPFGFAGAPLTLVKRIMANPRIHLKRRTLGEMEKQKPPLIEVRRPSGKRARPGEYPPTTRLRFL